MVRIFADSTCDLSEELINKYGITIVPLYINLGEKEYRDRVDITPDQIYEWSEANDTTPKTAAVAMVDAVEAMRETIDSGDEIIVFSISSQMSSTSSVFHFAAEEMEAEDKISVIDSQNLSTGIGLLVLEAAELAAAQRPRKEIVKNVMELIPRVRASFVVDTLVYLHRGGRCSAVAALAGSMLKLHPKIIVRDGAMNADKKYRGSMDTVIMKYVKDMEEEIKKAVPRRIFITHSGCNEELIRNVYAYLDSLKCFSEICITRAGGVISSHCGPGTLGVLFIS